MIQSLDYSLTASLMPLVISAFHDGRLVALIVMMVLCCAVVLKSGGAPALKFSLLLAVIVIIKEVLLRFGGPIAEYAFTGCALIGVIVFYGIRRIKMAQKIGGRQAGSDIPDQFKRIEIIKTIFLILAVIGVCLLVVKFYQRAEII